MATLNSLHWISLLINLVTSISQHYKTVHKGVTLVDSLFTKLGTVDEDLALSESSDESHEEMTNAANELEKEVIDM